MLCRRIKEGRIFKAVKRQDGIDIGFRCKDRKTLTIEVDVSEVEFLNVSVNGSSIGVGTNAFRTQMICLNADESIKIYEDGIVDENESASLSCQKIN